MWIYIHRAELITQNIKQHENVFPFITIARKDNIVQNYFLMIIKLIQI